MKVQRKNVTWRRYCCVRGCKNNTSLLHISLFGFPKDRKRTLMWLRNCNRMDLSNFTTEHLSRNYKVCSTHFEDGMFAGMSRCRLKKNAIPKVFDAEVQKSNNPELDTSQISEHVEEASGDNLNEDSTESVTDSPAVSDQCRTCLNVVDKCTSKGITENCLLDKSIKEVIIFLVPELDSKLGDTELVCHDCVKVLETTMKFIVKCLEVEEALDNSDKTIIKEEEDNLTAFSEYLLNEENGQSQMKIEVEDEPLECVDAEHDYCVKIASSSDLDSRSDFEDANKNDSSLRDPIDEDDQSNTRTDYDSLSHAAEMMEESLLNYCEQSVEVEDEEAASEKPAKARDALSCPTCSESFDTQEEHELHLNIHLPYACHVCGKAFRKKDSVRAHMVTHNDPNSFICEVCGKGFKEHGSLRYHLRCHRSDQSYMCDKCSKVFKARRLLDIHIKYVHNKFYESQCTVCGIMCRNRGNLNTHTRLVHFKEKPYECDICHRRFGRSDYLQNHRERHMFVSSHSDNKSQSETKKGPRRSRLSFKIMDTGEPVPCKFCGQWYKDLVRLKRHLETHLKRYPCQFCSLTFPRNILRQKHEEMHRGGTVSFFRCNVCWKKYKTKEALDEHATCHNNPQHFCDLCSKTFNRKYLLSQHKMMEHSHIPDKEQPEEIIFDSLLEVGGVST